jgi:hypothetical protein
MSKHITGYAAGSHDEPSRSEAFEEAVAKLDAMELDQATRYLETEREVSKIRAEANNRLSARIAELEALLREATAEKWVPTFDWWQRVRAALEEKLEEKHAD